MIAKSSVGFTLIEVLVALVILTLGVTGWVVSQNANVRSRDLSGTLATAQELTNSKIEDLISIAKQRKMEDGGISSQEIYSLPPISYTVLSTMNATRMVSDGMPVWLIGVTCSFEHYGFHRVSLERMVVGQ